jgi:hypothetical protein
VASRTAFRTLGGDEVEISVQLASQDYDCDAECGTRIHDETRYVRVAVLAARPQGSRDWKPAARRIEKYHQPCFDRIDRENG